jgi:Lrp/AsnC family transcriptional regulator
MDQFDRKILRVLQEEPSIPMQQLAEKIGLSHTPCWRRIKKLEAEGVIVNRVYVLDPKAVGLGITVFAHVKVRQHDKKRWSRLNDRRGRAPKSLSAFR